MPTVGIICEYNPFHNGHSYHLKKIKELFPESLVIAVISNYFTQRGDISILSKEEKTQIVLEMGIDLIVELPFIFSSQSADVFAKGAIAILKELNAEYLVFGSECNDVEKLKEIANIQLNNSFYEELVKAYMDDGVNYPTAMSKAIKDVSDLEIDTPNDLLGLSYVKEIIKQKANIVPITIKRTNNYHDKDLISNIASATAIREALSKGIDIRDNVPAIVYEFLKEKPSYDFFPFLKYKILVEEKDIAEYQTVDEGIENRIINNISNCATTEELINKIKTKRYTYNKLARMLIHILVSLKKDEASNQSLRYLRILGFNQSGREYLNRMKKNTNLPIIANIKKKDEELLKIDIRTEKIYDLITNNDPNNYKNPPLTK